MKQNEISIVKSKCPADGETKREYIKDLIYKLNKENHKVRESIFGAITRMPEWQVESMDENKD
jgi:hypothetical protein